MKFFVLFFLISLSNCHGDSNRAEIVGKFQKQEITRTYQSGPNRITELKSIYFLVYKLKGRIMTNQVPPLEWSQAFRGKTVRIRE